MISFSSIAPDLDSRMFRMRHTTKLLFVTELVDTLNIGSGITLSKYRALRYRKNESVISVYSAYTPVYV